MDQKRPEALQLLPHGIARAKYVRFHDAVVKFPRKTRLEVTHLPMLLLSCTLMCFSLVFET